MVLVRKCDVMSFLLGTNPSAHALKRLIKIVKIRLETKNGRPISQELLLQICRSALSALTQNKHREEDLYLGPVAVTAAFLRNASVFAETAKQTVSSFNEASYSALGELISLQDPVVSEDEYVLRTHLTSFANQFESSIVKVLTKSEELHKIYAALESFNAASFVATQTAKMATAGGI